MPIAVHEDQNLNKGCSRTASISCHQ